MPSNAELVNGMKSGDQSTSKQLIRKFSGALYQYAYLNFRSVEPDIVHNSVVDTFGKVLDSISSFEYQGEESCTKWIYKIFHNSLISSLRKTRAIKRGGQGQHLSCESMSERGLELQSDDNLEIDMERRNLIEKIYAGLSPQECLILHYISNGYATREIAEIFRSTESAIKSRRLRAKRKARQILGKE